MGAMYTRHVTASFPLAALLGSELYQHRHQRDGDDGEQRVH
jgi:hypothetical protein